MTHQEYRERLEEILTALVECSVDSSKHGYSKAYEYADDAKQAIDRLFLDAVGGDLPIGDEIAEGRSYTGERLHNKIKAELRTTITGKEGGDE